MPIMASVRLNLKPRLKPTPTFFMVDIMVTILDMPVIMDIPMPIMESVRLNLKPRLKPTPTFFMVDIMVTILDMRHYGYPYAYYGKREAEPKAKAEADPYLLYGGYY